MPLYEFRCKTCDELTEKICAMDTIAIVCPFCSNPADRIISVGSFILKGNGWYKTDFKGK